MRNLHLIILQEFGIEARHLLREWERLWLRSSDYRNHRIFSLRCIHNELVPVSIKLKSTLDTPKARQIIRKAEKDLLQAQVKAINNILDQVDREIQECKAKLASIISVERLEECQGFINKVSELRFNKVKQRQINKLNHLVAIKEGNITNNNITNPINRLAQFSANSHNPTPATALLPPGEGSNSPPATVHLSSEGDSFLNSQANNNITNNNIANITINPVNSQTNSQGLSPIHTPAIAHLPLGEGSNSLLGALHLPSEGDSSPQSTSSTPAREENNSSQANNPQSSSSPQSGQGNNPPRAGRQGTRHPPGNNPYYLPRRPAQPPGKVTLPPHPPAVPTKVLPMKNLTQSGSLTFPTNLWPQHKGLYWLKGPTLRLPLGSLLT